MDAFYLWLPVTAFLAAGLTLFTGFGLNTLVLPVLVVFLPPAEAVLVAGSVHLLNNLFKLVLLGRHANWRVALRFGLPAVLAAVMGAWLLQLLAGTDDVLYSVAVFGVVRSVSGVGFVLGLLILVFAIFEMAPAFARLALPQRYLPMGGLLSGFFGGLSGHQGALRSAFLVRLGLAPSVFVATGVVISTGVDVSRIAYYLFIGEGMAAHQTVPLSVLGATVAAAFTGSYIGSRLLQKVTLHALQRVVGAVLALLACAMLLGLL